MSASENNNISINPFLFSRIEKERSPTIYVTDGILEWLNPKSYLFQGPRGCGKSSLLNAFRWEVAWANPPLLHIKSSRKVKEALLNNPAHIGVYIRFEGMDIGYWHQWERRSSEEWAERYFGTLLEFNIGYQIFNALHKIRLSSKDDLFSDAESEYNIVNNMLSLVFSGERIRPQLIEYSFGALSRLFLDYYYGLRSMVYSLRDLKVINDSYPVVAPGDVIGLVGNKFLEHYSRSTNWTIDILMDDCDILHSWQAKVINAAIVKAQAPIGYKLCSVVDRYPTRSTIDPNRSLTDYELQPVKLPSDEYWKIDSKYIQMANEVCKLRIKEAFDESSLAQSFKIKKTLGNYNLEEALLGRLVSSEKHQKVGSFLAETPVKQNVKQITKKWLDDNQIRKIDYISYEDINVQKKEARRVNSEYYKKWKHAAAIALMREFGLKYPYWGFRIALHLAGGSIREVLRIMYFIWEKAKLSPEGFVRKTPIHPNKQRAAMETAAKRFMESLNSNPMTQDGPSLQDICKRLGLLFNKFQSPKYMIANPETAALHYTEAHLPETTMQILNTCFVSGALISNQESKNELALHPILAPHFQIMFRRPFYYPAAVSSDELTTLLSGTKTQWKAVEQNILRRRLSNFNKKNFNPNQKTLRFDE